MHLINEAIPVSIGDGTETETDIKSFVRNTRHRLTSYSDRNTVPVRTKETMFCGPISQE